MLGQFWLNSSRVAHENNRVAKIARSRNRANYVRFGIIIAPHCIDGNAHTALSLFPRQVQDWSILSGGRF
jgi:hypothetical protein